MRVFLWIALLCALAVAAKPANALTFGQGHGDVGIWYVPGQGYELMLSNGAEWQADPSSAVIVVGGQSRETVPASLTTSNSGLTAGSPIWKLPQSGTEAATEGLPWLGMQIHGGPLGASASSAGSADVRLELVSASGPGQLLMWQDLEPNLYGLAGPGGPGFESRTDLLASPAAAFNSALAVGNHVDCWNHMHTHVNWGFTAAGEYLVTLNVNGETENDGAFTNSATFRFLVEDQSHVLPRFGDLTGDGVVDRGDLATLSQAFGTTSAATSATGDLDGDGRVGLRDLVLLRNEIGGLAAPSSTTAPFPSTSPTIESQGGAIGELMTALGASLNSSSVAAAAVPEPSTLALAGCGVLAAGWISRRRARK